MDKFPMELEEFKTPAELRTNIYESLEHLQANIKSSILHMEPSVPGHVVRPLRRQYKILCETLPAIKKTLVEMNARERQGIPQGEASVDD